MSTLFTSAAMGLLSRTLQAFLYKYLSDVDVEGVEVPSFTDSSGWGIRLSNVRLREGTKLLTLPGKMKPTAQEQKKKENSKTKSDNGSKEGNDPQRAADSTNRECGDEEMSNATERSAATRSRWFTWSASSGMNDISTRDGEAMLNGGSLHGQTANDDPTKANSTGANREHTMELKIGKGGKIGVLDVRLVGKSVHILIEDADLILEVVESQDATPTTREDPQEKDSSAEKQTPKLSPEPESVGDRVLAENVIAKILAAIPNLFLRDIRLRLVLPSGEDRTRKTCVEVNVELLSFTDGADFLMNFGATRGGEAEEQSQAQSSETSFDDDGISDDVLDSHTSENEFFMKRIRTGRGLEGGVTIRVLNEKETIPKFNSPGPLWAKERWYQDTNDVVLRCSGVDLTARIYLGTRAETSKRKQEVVQYDELDLDSLLFGGCDYVVPGPVPNVRPPEAVLPQEPVGSWTSTNGPANLLKQDNGIQAFAIPSHFHQVAAGLKPYYCSRDHPPNALCLACWRPRNDICVENMPHSLDNSSPLGGLTCQLSITEPLEINIDRASLETISSLISLFTKPKSSSSVNSETVVHEREYQGARISRPRSLGRTGSSRKSQRDVRKRHNAVASFDDSYRSMDSARSKQSAAEDANKRAVGDVSQSFPIYMQPEKIQFLGLYVSEIRCRIHILKHNESKYLERGSGFCYWEANMGCVALDHQCLTAKERPFLDTRVGLGFCKLVENRGVGSLTIASFGKQEEEKRQSSVCRPSTASVMLDLVAPLESLAQKTHGDCLQLRYFSVTDTTSIRTKHYKAAIVFVATPMIDTMFSIKDDVACFISETVRSFSRSKAKKSPNQAVSRLHYKLTANGGHVKMSPVINATFPPLTVHGEISSESGFSVEAAFDEIKLKYGKSSAPKASDVGLSLQQLAVLPETVRFRILLFLKDLTPFETALGLPRSQNSFLQCRAVNNAIVEAAQRRRTFSDVHRANGHSRMGTSRAEMLEELMSLDDTSLSDLLRFHRQSGQ